MVVPQATNAAYSSPRVQGHTCDGNIKDSEGSNVKAGHAVVNGLQSGWKLPGPASNASVGEGNFANQERPRKTHLSCGGTGHKEKTTGLFLTEKSTKIGIQFEPRRLLAICHGSGSSLAGFLHQSVLNCNLVFRKKYILFLVLVTEVVLFALWDGFPWGGVLASLRMAFACCLFSSLKACFQAEKLGYAPLLPVPKLSADVDCRQ